MRRVRRTCEGREFRRTRKRESGSSPSLLSANTDGESIRHAKKYQYCEYPQHAEWNHISLVATQTPNKLHATCQLSFDVTAIPATSQSPLQVPFGSQPNTCGLQTTLRRDFLAFRTCNERDSRIQQNAKRTAEGSTTGRRAAVQQRRASRILQFFDVN